MSRHDQLTLDFHIAHSEGCPAPAFLDYCSVAPTAIGRWIETVNLREGPFL